MRLGYFIFITAALITMTSCMKKSKIRSIQNQSNISDPSTPTAECPNGVVLSAEPLSVTGGVPVFYTYSPVTFKIVATGCKYGYQLNGTTSRNFSRTIYTNKQYTTAQTENVETFSVSIRDAAGNAVREFEVESDPFRIDTMVQPQCELEPAQAFVDGSGTVRVKFTPSESGKLLTIAPQANQAVTISQISPGAPPTAGRDVVANRSYDYILTTSGGSGVIDFKYRKNLAAGVTPPSNLDQITGTCSVEVIPSLCNAGVQADFLGNGGSQDLRIVCDTRTIQVTPVSGGAVNVFATLANISNIRQLIPGNINGDSKADLLIFKKNAANDEATFQLGITQANNTFNSKINEACATKWKIDGKSLPEQFHFEPKGTGPAKIWALIGADQASAVRYQATIQANSDGSCNLSQPAVAGASISISADKSTISHGESVVITWGAVNVAGSTCSLKKKLSSEPDANYQVVAGEENKNAGGAQVVSHPVASGAITASTDFQASCFVAGGIDLKEKVTIQVDDASFPLKVFESTLSGSPSISFFHPEIPEGKNIGDFTGKDLYLTWNRPAGASSCQLVRTPVVGNEVVESIARESNGPRTIKTDRTTTFKIRCNGVDDISKLVVMGGAPQLKTGTATSASWANVEPNAAQTAKPLILTANGQGAKIKLISVAIGNQTGSAGSFSVNEACNNVDLNPVASSECAVNITYNSGGRGTSRGGKLEVSYKRYNDRGELLPEVYKNVMGSVSGSVKAGGGGGGGRPGK